MFYGDTCPFCRLIMPALARFERETGVVIERLEVWSNPVNAEKMEALRHLYDEHCGGNMVIPSFYDANTGRLLCNPGSYEELKAWYGGEHG